MKHSTGKPTKAQKRRFDSMCQIGCIACLEGGYGFQPAQIHHLLSGGKRMGHDFTIPLCPWHHMGEVPEGYTARDFEAIRGPSLALNKRKFVETFGTESWLFMSINMLISVREQLEKP